MSSSEVADKVDALSQKIDALMVVVAAIGRKTGLDPAEVMALAEQVGKGLPETRFAALKGALGIMSESYKALA